MTKTPTGTSFTGGRPSASDRRVGADRQACQRRIEELRDYAEQDGYVMNSGSESDFWNFVRSDPCLRRGNLVLLENGNLRAVWKDGHGNRVGLEFLGEGRVLYLAFKRRSADGPPLRDAGHDSLDGARRRIDDAGLRVLMSLER